MDVEITPNSDPEIREMEKEIKEIVGGPIIRSVNGFFEDEIYFANSWLGSIHSHARRGQGDTDHSSRANRDKRQRLAGIANRLDLDFEELLQAKPREEVRIIYEALMECERTGYDRPD